MLKCIKKAKESKQKQVLSSNRYKYPYFMSVPDLGLLKAPNTARYDYYIIHVTAGWRNQSATSFVKNFLGRGLCTEFMEESGQIFCQRDWSKQGSHIGKAKLFGKPFRTTGIGGIEIACGGKLDDNNKTWFGKVVDVMNRRTVTREDGYVHGGTYEKLTPKQEDSLALYISWLLFTYPGITILSHDELSGYRGKTDVGGCLSMPMQDFIKTKAMPLVEKWKDGTNYNL